MHSHHLSPLTSARPRTASFARVASAVALTATLLGGLAAATSVKAAPLPEPRPQCQTVGPITQCIGPAGVTQQVGSLFQSTGAGGVVSQSSNVSAGSGASVSQSSVVSSGSGASVSQSVSSGGGVSQVVSSGGGVSQVVSSGAGLTAMPALPTDVPLAIALVSADRTEYHLGETVTFAYAVNQPMTFRVVSVQGTDITTLAQGSGSNSRGMVSVAAGPAVGQQVLKVVGLAADLTPQEASITINVVP